MNFNKINLANFLSQLWKGLIPKLLQVRRKNWRLIVGQKKKELIAGLEFHLRNIGENDFNFATGVQFDYRNA